MRRLNLDTVNKHFNLGEKRKYSTLKIHKIVTIVSTSSSCSVIKMKEGKDTDTGYVSPLIFMYENSSQVPLTANI